MFSKLQGLKNIFIEKWGNYALKNSFRKMTGNSGRKAFIFYQKIKQKYLAEILLSLLPPVIG